MLLTVILIDGVNGLIYSRRNADDITVVLQKEIRIEEKVKNQGGTERMNMIVAADDQWAIGNKGELLVTIPADHRFFRQETTGKVIVYGRKTLHTFPQEMPLSGRDNIILSADPFYKVKNACVVHSLKELSVELKKYPAEDIYVVGGESVYRQLLPYCNVVHVTRIHQNYAADAYFPDLDQRQEWRITQDSDEQTYFDLTYHFLKYQRVV